MHVLPGAHIVLNLYMLVVVGGGGGGGGITHWLRATWHFFVIFKLVTRPTLVTSFFHFAAEDPVAEPSYEDTSSLDDDQDHEEL